MPDQSASLLSKLSELHAERLRTWPAEELKVNVEQRQHLVDALVSARRVSVGDVVEPFSLEHFEGGDVTLENLTIHGPTALIFFRFASCPACNIVLPHYQERLAPKLAALGIPLVAVSPQRPDRLIKIKARHRLTFIVASDPQNELGRRFGLLYEFDQPSKQAALAKGNAIGDVTGTGTWELPMPAVIVIDRDKVIRFVDISPDWLVRTEAETILAAIAGWIEPAAIPADRAT